METDPRQIIDLARLHFWRAAYHTRDNPYLRSRVGEVLSPDVESALRAILEGTLEPARWLASADGRASLSAVQVGTVPRDLQLVLRDGEDQVGVESVHAFVRAPLFWWLVSYLWCVEVGRTLDAMLDGRIMGYRLHPRFVEAPDQSTRMFQSPSAAYERWRRSATDMAAQHAGQVMATSTVDLRDFYYSVSASPSAVVRAFMDGAESQSELSRNGWALTQLLDAMHERYAAEDARVKPRSDAITGATPLPVGLPSSQVLANLIVEIALRDLASAPAVTGLSAYADDILVLSPLLPDVDEATIDYFGRLGIVTDDEDPVLASSTAVRLAGLAVSTDKSETSYSRVREAAGQDDADGAINSPPQADDIDPYLSGRPSADWGGRLRTVLKAPFRRDRVPKELARAIVRITDEIRVGIDPADAEQSLGRFVEELDQGAFLALRPYWTELIASSWFAGGASAVNGLSRLLDNAVAALEPPPDSTPELRDAIQAGLRDSWAQALAEALAARTDRRWPTGTRPDPAILRQATGLTLRSLSARARALRAARFVPSQLVSMPLSEFSDWRGGLFGERAFTAFQRWVESQRVDSEPAEIQLGNAKRFVALHEICLAVHLWVAPTASGWTRRVFRTFRSQPLIDDAMVADLLTKSRDLLRAGPPARQRAERVGDYVLRFAMPSMEVVGEAQLDAVLKRDRVSMSAIARDARRVIETVVRGATRRQADVLVLPEWAVITRQLPWLFAQAARHQVLIVAGEAPAVAGGVYSNRIWTGLPVIDSDGHRACLVPPPREKQYLSHHELGRLKAFGVTPTTTIETPPVYCWRGVNFASLVCFEFADIRAREALRATADLLTVSSWNPDWRYFTAVQEATTRDNYCITLCVNTGQFPGTHLMRPTKSEMAIAASVHGSSDPTIVTCRVDMLPIVAARAMAKRPIEIEGLPDPADGIKLSNYKPLPPTF